MCVLACERDPLSVLRDMLLTKPETFTALSYPALSHRFEVEP
jgi:hypothetical protein